MNLNIKKRIVAVEPHAVTIQSSSLDKKVQAQLTKGAQVLPFQSFDLIIRTIDGQFRGGVGTGYTEQGINSWFQRLISLKKNDVKNSDSLIWTDWETLTLSENEVAVGVDLARSLGLLEGDEVTLIPPETLLLSSLETPVFQKVTVKRILATDLYDLDSKLILFNMSNSLKSFSKTLSNQRGFHIWFDNLSEAESFKNNFDITGVQISTWQEKNSDLFFALTMEKTMIGVFLGLAGLIASSSILTVLALLMSQKKRDIALIKTLGLSQKKTLWLFTKMGLWIAGGGVALGTVIGVSVSLYLQFFPLNVLPNIYYDSSIPALVNFGFVFIVVLIAGILAFAGSYFPALATLSIQPALLLRSKN